MGDRSGGISPQGRLTLGEPAATRSPALYWLIAVLAILAGSAGAWLIASSDHLVYAAAYAILQSVQVLSSVGIGLYYWFERPYSPLGTVLVAYGFANALIGLQGTDLPILALLGVVAEVAVLILVMLLVLVYRRRSLDGGARVVLGVWTFLVITLYVPWLLLHPVIEAPTALGLCQKRCPPNPLFVSNAGGWLTVHLPGLTSAWRIGLFLVLGGVFLFYFPSLRRSAVERRVVIPVLLPLCFWATASSLYGAFQLGGVASQLLFWVLYHARALFPFSFLFGFLATESYRWSALASTVKGLSLGSEEEAILARALADPQVTLAFWLPSAGQFVDVDGRQVVAPPAGSGRALTELRQNGQLVGAIISDAAIAEERDLLEAAAQAVTMASSNRRLRAELTRAQGEVSAARADSAAVVERQRRRIERNLHDSAQQQLLAMELRLQVLAGLTRDAELHRRLAAVREDLNGALRSMRDLARGARPSLLGTAGLTTALTEATRDAPIAVHFSSRGVGRYPGEIEEAIYFCCMEAVQNAEKHGGENNAVTVELEGTADEIRFTVTDRGPGFDPQGPFPGQGLKNMEERMHDVGGWLRIASQPGQPTTISGGVPVAGNRSTGAPDRSDDGKS